MHIERRELYAVFWDDGRGVCALLIGWTDDLLPAVAHRYGIQIIEPPFEIIADFDTAMTEAEHLPRS